MNEIPNRPLTPAELDSLKRRMEWEKIENALDREWAEQSAGPAAWFGRLLGTGAVALFLDTVGWVVALLHPKLSFVLNLLLDVAMTVAVLGLAALSVWGLVHGYRHQQKKKSLRVSFEAQGDRSQASEAPPPC